MSNNSMVLDCSNWGSSAQACTIINQLLQSFLHLWETWDVRVVILFSLTLQLVLTFSAPLRKRTTNTVVVWLILLSFLLAQATATYAAGLFAQSYNHPDSHIRAFWASFILLHLGGPDTITATAYEDIALWLRGVLTLFYQVYILNYFRLQSLNPNMFLSPTALMYTVGYIKYFERIWSLHLATPGVFRYYLVEEPSGQGLHSNADEIIDHAGARVLSDLEAVTYAYEFFKHFKGLVVDLAVASSRVLHQSRDFFLKRSPEDAFKVVEAELNFFYDVLYTKAQMLQSRLGIGLRCITSILISVALWLFCKTDKVQLKTVDVNITYTLLISALTLEIIGIAMILSSDWTAARLSAARWKSAGSLQSPSRKLFGCSSTWPFLHRRWPKSISQYNLVAYSFYQPFQTTSRINRTFRFSYLSDRLMIKTFVEKQKFNDNLRDLIFEELKTKSRHLETSSDNYSARGDWILRHEGLPCLLPWINQIDFDESIMLWHVATELCLCSTGSGHLDSASSSRSNNNNVNLSKVLSRYMFYLLIIQTDMMSPVAGFWDVRFKQTCREAEKIFRGDQPNNGIFKRIICMTIKHFKDLKMFYSSCCRETTSQEELRKACEQILQYDGFAERDDTRRSVIYEARELAKELDSLGDERKWQIMSKVWAEMLSYAATHCKASGQAALLSNGGELVTLVWLLMNHFGFVEKPLTNKGMEGQNC